MGPPPAPNHDPAATREAILLAARDLMAERSYGGTAVPDVASRAGVAAGTIYRHFSGKEALVNAVYRDCKLLMQRSLVEAVASATSPREGFHRIWRGLWEFSRKHPSAFRFLEMHRHQTYLEPESQQVATAVFQGVAEFVRSGQQQGAIRDAAPEVLIALAFGAFVGLAKEAESGHLPLDESTIEAAEDAVWGLLRA